MNKRAVILLGPPAVGKGSVSALLSSFGYRVITMSDILHEKIAADKNFEKNFLSMVQEGGLVPDQFILEVLFEKIKLFNGDNIVLDGCTRTLNQKKFVYDWLVGNGYSVLFIYLEAEEKVCIERMGIRTQEFKSNGQEPRVDDQNQNAKIRRLRNFYDNIDPILESISNGFLRVDANRKKADVFIFILQQLSYRSFV
jgi:adenylate kinase family enzyme